VNGGTDSGNVGGTEGASIGASHSEDASCAISDGAGIVGGAACGNSIWFANMMKHAGDILSLH
jgi:hypothetical protein